MIGNAAFLLPSGRMRPERGTPPSITNCSAKAPLGVVEVSTRGNLPAGFPGTRQRRRRAATPGVGCAAMTEEIARDRDAAWSLLCEHTKGEALRRHGLAVEAAVRAYARARGDDEAAWGCVALLHDFDYEIHPTLDRHPQDGAPILRARGYPEWFVRAVLTHADHLHLARETPLERTLYACDELAGFVHACALVRPDGLEGLEARSVRKKLKQKSFAAGVNREDVRRGAEGLGVDLDEHIAVVVDALRPHAAALGLPQG